MELPFKLPPITPRYLLDTRRYLSLSAAVAMVVILILMVGIVPQIQAALEIQQKSAVEAKKLASLQQKARQLEAILTPDILGQIDTVNVLLPSKKPLLELLSSLNQVANEAQVTFSGIELSPGSIATEATTVAPAVVNPKSKKKVVKSSSASDSLDVNLVVLGNLANLNQFFELVERTTPLTTITTLSLAPKNKGTGVGSAGSSLPIEARLGQSYEATILVSAAYFTQSVSSAVDAQLPDLSQSQQDIVNELATFSVQPFQNQPSIQGGGLEDLFGIQQPQIEISQ